ncbi:uncharacterized protein [Choristoneura fumiferana]|uniref:uncharacterized protein n=1 Tax=Choristoneura fumiferana TaxID=7141 RepID=UPI003D15C09F
MTATLWLDCVVFVCLSCVMALEPGSCRTNEYYEPGAMVCQLCPANASLVASDDGFACSCEEHSVPVTPGRCKPCGAAAVVSSDGAACVPRRCQGAGGRTVCRKCPADYISVTQNFDGSPMKEVLCVKCARGYKPSGNACVRCAGCACARNEVIVRDACVPRSFVNARQKYEGGLHPYALLDVVKYEYLCIHHNYRACRTLASECVKNFYTNEAAGPCRLWMQPNLVSHKGLPALLIESPNDKDPDRSPSGRDESK